MMKLYELAHSPYCASIRCAMAGLGLKFESILIDNWDRRPVIEASGGAYYAVPLLMDDDVAVYPGCPLARDIQYYLNERYASGHLIPSKNLAAQEIVTDYIEGELEGAVFKLGDPAYIDSIPDLVNRVMTVRHKERRFGVGCIEAWRRNAGLLRTVADGLLARFETTLRGQDFLFGETPVFADYALYGVLFNMTFDNRSELHEDQRALRDFMKRLEVWRYGSGQQG